MPMILKKIKGAVKKGAKNVKKAIKKAVSKPKKGKMKEMPKVIAKKTSKPGDLYNKNKKPFVPYYGGYGGKMSDGSGWGGEKPKKK